jgi:hypothetical protein
MLACRVPDLLWKQDTNEDTLRFHMDSGVRGSQRFFSLGTFDQKSRPEKR